MKIEQKFLQEGVAQAKLIQIKQANKKMKTHNGKFRVKNLIIKEKGKNIYLPLLDPVLLLTA